MLQLMILLAVSMGLAYCSQNNILVYSFTKKHNFDLPLIAMVLILSFFVGLRTHFNDTSLYIELFKGAPTFREFLNSEHELADNPLFYAFQSLFRHHISDNPHIYLISIALFTNASIICFIKKFSDNFPFSMLLFFALGQYVSTMAAMKQCIAIAILTYGIKALLKKKYLIFYIFVLIAMLFHAYAIFFVILPIFINKPWTITTYITVFGVAFVLLTFESTITSFLNVASDAGKEIDSKYVFDEVGINLFRLAVFSVPAILSFIFQGLLDKGYNAHKNVMMNMSILSFLIMLMGIFGGANLFGRSAIYFELGTIVIMPWIVKELFDEESQNFAHILVGGCYLAFFAYSVIDFSSGYKMIGLGEFIKGIF